MALLPSWSQVTFLTIAIRIVIVAGNMVELVVETTGPGVRWASVQVLVPPPTSCGTLSLGVLIGKRGANIVGGMHGLNAIMHVKCSVSANKDLHHYAFCLLVSKAISIGGYRCWPGYHAICKERSHDLLSK